MCQKTIFSPPQNLAQFPSPGVPATSNPWISSKQTNTTLLSFLQYKILLLLLPLSTYNIKEQHSFLQIVLELSEVVEPSLVVNFDGWLNAAITWPAQQRNTVKYQCA